MKVIIAGGRDFRDYDRLRDACNSILTGRGEITVISGDARGADTLGKRYAGDMGYGLLLFPALWDTYGSSAGTERNKRMASIAEVLIAFWDGRSHGTRDMIQKALINGLEVHVFTYSELNKKQDETGEPRRLV